MLYYSNKDSECLKTSIFLEGRTGVAEPGSTCWEVNSFLDPSVDVTVSLQHLPADAAAGPAQAGHTLAPAVVRQVLNVELSAPSKAKPHSPCANQQHMHQFALHVPHDSHWV